MFQLTRNAIIILNCVVLTFFCQGCGSPGSSSSQKNSADKSSGKSQEQLSLFNKNEPEGFSVITERSFSNYGESWFENSNGHLSIILDPTAPRSPRNIGRITYPAGFKGGYEPAKTGFEKFSSKKIYVSFSIKHSANWQGHPSGVNKILFITDSSSGKNGDPVYLLMDGTTPDYFFQIRRQGPFGAINFSQNENQVFITPGEWMNVEVLLVMNSDPSLSNGEAHLWVNGVKTSEHYDIMWSDGDCTWDSVRWEPIWGGLGDSIKEKMTMDVDHIYVSGK